MSAGLRQQITDLQQHVARLEGELAAAQRANREIRDLAAKQADRLQPMQGENESAYRELYVQAHGPRAGWTGLREPVAVQAAKETDPGRRTAFRMIRRADRGTR